MKRMLLLVLIALLAVVGPVSAQTLIQQSPTTLNACTLSQNKQATAGAVGTITITPPAGQYVYLCELDVHSCAGASAITGAAPLFVTSTGLGANNPQWMLPTGGNGVTANNAGSCYDQNYFYPGGLKSAATGTNVTIVGPTSATNQTVNVNAIWYYAP
jgi:hypothetical protein